jgi:hypothetical protein
MRQALRCVDHSVSDVVPVMNEPIQRSSVTQQGEYQNNHHVDVQIVDVQPARGE